MGADLTQAPKNAAPSFLIRAVKDPDGANLDRVQVVKGWRDQKGQLHETIFNVALSDHRQVGANGDVPAVGNTIDLKTASYTNTIGDQELAVVWRDPTFNPQESAFYYVRVLEIPTPRWPAYDAAHFGVEIPETTAFYGVEMPEGVIVEIQERAYTSPIWYTPH